MRIDFFEEYSDLEILKKATLINFPSTIYLASNSLTQFEKNKSVLKKINPALKSAYWPILKSSYWISPFSNTIDLENLTNELFQKRNIPLKVLIDLEPPVLNPLLFFTNLLSFDKNKRLINSILNDASKYNLQISTAEIPAIGPITKPLLQKFGLHYSEESTTHEVIDMYYTSIIGSNWLKKLKSQKFKFLALGTIATGPYKFEPILSAKNLEKNLNTLKNIGVKKVVIYRLGGLNKDYLDIIQRFIK